MKTIILILLGLFLVGCSESSNPTAGGNTEKSCNVTTECYIEKTVVLSDSRSDTFPTNPTLNQMHLNFAGEIFYYDGQGWINIGFTLSN